MNRPILFGFLCLLLLLLSTPPGTSYAQCTPGYQETQKILGTTTSFWSQFGHAVAIDGEVMAIGLPNAHFSYSSYVSVYELRDNTWVWVQDLVPPDNILSSFGFSVAVSGQTIVVGDPLFANGEGAVWVFTKSGAQWVPDSNNPIQPTNRQSKSDFGYAVAMSNDRILVGAPRYTHAVSSTGMAFLFTRSGGTWREGQLGPSAADAGHFRYGHAVAIDGDLAVIGAPDDIDSTGAGGAGRVTVWENLQSWTLTKRLQSSDVASGDRFGHAVAVQGHTVAIGAPYHEEYYTQGAVYFYERDASQADVYHQRARVVPDYYCTGGYTLGFGFSVALDGTDLVIGAPSSGMDGKGEAWLYKEKRGRWVAEQVYHHAKADRRDNLGYAVAVSNAVTVVGAPFHGKHRQGAAFVYDQVQLKGNKQGERLPAVEEEAPGSFALAQNHPNPFNPSTRIQYSLAEAAPVLLEVYDLTGRRVATLTDEVQAAGVHEVVFEAAHLPSGTYLYRLSAGANRETRIMVLLR